MRWIVTAHLIARWAPVVMFFCCCRWSLRPCWRWRVPKHRLYLSFFITRCGVRRSRSKTVSDSICHPLTQSTEEARWVTPIKTWDRRRWTHPGLPIVRLIHPNFSEIEDRQRRNRHVMYMSEFQKRGNVAASLVKHILENTCGCTGHSVGAVMAPQLEFIH